MTYERIGYSTQNREILCFKIGPHWGGKVLWQACIHGREMINAEILWLYAKWLVEKKEPEAKRILTRNLTMIIPVLNIDNYNVTRKNANGVDLNRNFELGWCCGSRDPARWDYKGPATLSEKESQAFHSFVMRQRPVFFMDMHTGMPYILFKVSASAYGKPAEYGTRISKALALYKQIAGDRGQNPNEYIIKSLGPCGRAVCCSVNHGSHAFLWEFHPIERTIPNGPPYEEVEPVWFPKFLPMGIALSQACEVKPPTLQIMGLLSASGFLFLVALRNDLKKQRL